MKIRAIDASDGSDGSDDSDDSPKYDNPDDIDGSDRWSVCPSNVAVRVSSSTVKPLSMSSAVTDLVSDLIIPIPTVTPSTKSEGKLKQVIPERMSGSWLPFPSSSLSAIANLGYWEPRRNHVLPSTLFCRSGVGNAVSETLDMVPSI